MTIDEIKKLLKGITPGKWSVKSSDYGDEWWFGGENCGQQEVISDGKKKNFVCVYGGKDTRDANFIAQSPEIVRFLLERVEELQQWEPAFCTQANCNHSAHGFESAHVSALMRKIDDLELRYQAARNLMIMEIYLDDPVKYVDQEIQAEVKRLKEVDK